MLTTTVYDEVTGEYYTRKATEFDGVGDPGEEKHMSKWSEIRCDFINEDDGFWRVDAWLTDDDNEEGEVIAYISDENPDIVIYHDNEARVDEYAQEIIKFMQKELMDLIRERLVC